MPNVIIIMADDLGYADLGFQGSQHIRTPHLDKLATGGVRFTDGHVSASVCSPSRAGMITGRHQQRFGHHANSPPGVEHGMDPEETTLAEALKSQGYTTALFGKWHLGASESRYPTNQGFDEFIGLRSGSRSYWFDKKKDDKAGSVKSIEHNGEQIEFEGYFTDRLGDWCAEFIDRDHEAPFFIFLSFTAPHGPLHATEEDLAALETKDPYAAMVYGMDRNVGKVVAALEKRGLMEDTLIWFLSDNGGITKQSSNDPLRGTKGSAFEGGNRVPFFVHWQGTVPAGETFEPMITSLDIYPTSLAAAGGDPGENGRPLDGVDLMPFLTGDATGAPHERFYWKRENIASYREGPWKLIRLGGHGVALFNLEDDLNESKNMAGEMLERAGSMAERLASWEGELAEPGWHEAKVWNANREEMHLKEFTPVRVE